jgi:hypothetical protein
MAENTTTYTTIIDTQVQGAEQVGDLGDKAQETDGKFKALRSQIRETNVALQKLADEGKGGTAEFEKLRAKLDELNDAQDKVNFQAGQFDDQLAALPGPIGQVGGAIQGFNEGLNKFSTGFKLALGAVTLIIAAIAAFRESLSRTEEGQAKLNKITQAFEKIMNGLFAIIEPIAMLFADLIVELLESEKVMNTLSTVAGVLTGTFTALFGIVQALGGFIINNFVNAFKTLTNVAGAAGKVLKGVFTFDLELIKEGLGEVGESIKTGFNSFVDNAKTTAKGIGTAVVNGVTQGFETGANAFKEGAKRLTKEEREAAKKRAEEFKKEQEAALKELETYQKAASDLRKTGRQKELDDNDTQFKTLLEKAKKYGLDVEKLKEANRIKVAEINKKYDKEDIEKNISALDQIAKDTDKALTDRLAAFDKQLVQTKELLDKGAIDQIEYAKRVGVIEKEITAVKKEEADKQREQRILSIENEILLDEQKYSRRLALVNSEEQMIIEASKMAKKAALEDETLTEAERESIIRNANQRIIEITKSASAERVAIQTERYNEQIANINAKEQELLSNTKLTEAERTQIMIAAQQDRAAVRMAEVDDQLLGIDNELNNISTSFDRRRQLIAEKEALLLADTSLTENQRTAIQQAASNERQNIANAELEAKAAIQTAELDLASQAAGLLKEIAGKNKKLQIAAVVVEQAAAIGKIAVNTGIANAKALAASPLTFGQPWVTINTISGVLAAASAVAAGVKAIQQINSADSGTAASAPSINAPRGGQSISAPRVESAVAPQIQTGGGQNPSQQIADTIGAASGKPIKTYVLAQDVSSKQAFDRRTNNAASF